MSSSYRFELVENCQACPLRSNGYFCDLPGTVLKEFESIKYTMAYPQDAVLFVQGESPRGVYMLCKGRIKLSITSPQGKSLIARIAQAGDILGVESAVSGKPSLTTAETLEPCQINFVSLKGYLKFLRENVEASLRTAQELGRSYQIACERIRSLGLSQSAPEKLARFLLDWTDHKRQEDERSRTRLTLTHEQIGQVIGTSRETVTRIFGDFRSKQLVTIQGSVLSIQNRPGLESVAAS